MWWLSRLVCGWLVCLGIVAKCWRILLQPPAFTQPIHVNTVLGGSVWEVCVSQSSVSLCLLCVVSILKQQRMW